MPALAKTQRLHNVGLAIEALKEVSGDGGPVAIKAKDIVEGHREKTLAFIWQLILQWSVGELVDCDALAAETERICSLHAAAASLPAANVFFVEEHMTELLSWSRAVCAVYNLPVHNFTVSFSDGRALCYLVHFYHPALLPLDQVNNETTYKATLKSNKASKAAASPARDRESTPEPPSDDEADGGALGAWTKTFSPTIGGVHEVSTRCRVIYVVWCGLCWLTVAFARSVLTHLAHTHTSKYMQLTLLLTHNTRVLV